MSRSSPGSPGVPRVVRRGPPRRRHGKSTRTPPNHEPTQLQSAHRRLPRCGLLILGTGTTMLSVSNVSMRYGSKVLFEEVSVSFVQGRRYGLTGPNGSGKSTFMKVLTGELDAQKGTVLRPKRVGVLSQDQFAFDAFRVVD